jgi:hypothetical protein
MNSPVNSAARHWPPSRHVRQVSAEAVHQARVVQRFTERGEAADQPQRAEGLMPQDVQARWRCGPSSSEKAITQIAEKQVPTTSA